MARPRVLLVDDDATMQRFVALALDEQEIELLGAPSVAEALALLRRTGPVDLLLTDLMMPGASGIDLLQALAAEPALRGAARLAVLSAGLTQATGAQLEALGVWRTLRKPVSVAELDACVAEATQGGRRGEAPAAAPGAAEALRSAAEEAAIAEHFGGQRALYLEYRAACLVQFRPDIEEGDAAAERGDLPALRRLGHNLKTVLATLGHAEGSALGRQLEHGAAAGDATAAVALWPPLRRCLEALSR